MVLDLLGESVQLRVHVLLIFQISLEEGVLAIRALIVKSSTDTSFLLSLRRAFAIDACRPARTTTGISRWRPASWVSGASRSRLHRRCRRRLARALWSQHDCRTLGFHKIVGRWVHGYRLRLLCLHMIIRRRFLS